jgi:hypothetical protein
MTGVCREAHSWASIKTVACKAPAPREGVGREFMTYPLPRWGRARVGAFRLCVLPLGVSPHPNLPPKGEGVHT